MTRYYITKENFYYLEKLMIYGNNKLDPCFIIYTYKKKFYE